MVDDTNHESAEASNINAVTQLSGTKDSKSVRVKEVNMIFKSKDSRIEITDLL